VESEITSWLLVFLRVSALLALFPVFSTANIPVQLRLGLGVLVAMLVAPLVPPFSGRIDGLWPAFGAMLAEVGVGLLMGFAARMVFYAAELAGAIISAEMGLSLPSVINPVGEGQATAPGLILNYMAALLWLTLDLHHWMLAGFQRSYSFVPLGGARISELLIQDLVLQTGRIFVVAVQMTAPIMAVSVVVSVIFSALGRVVPQMNVFAESFPARTLATLAVFGLTLNLMSQHLVNYLRRLPEDMLRVTQMLGG
jgi:flagellar biosynthesis protein FliR